MFEVICPCGKAIPVRAGQAGSTAACSCGQTVPVPLLSELRRAAAEAGRSPAPPPPLRHDWKVWWWGIALAVPGELLHLIGWVMMDTFTTEPASHAYAAIAMILVGFVMLFVGLIAVGVGKGYSVGLCLLLIFIIPCGRLALLALPGKGADPTP
jgi:hypothetical protein